MEFLTPFGEAVKNLPWPKQNEFYMAKQFLIVK